MRSTGGHDTESFLRATLPRKPRGQRGFQCRFARYVNCWMQPNTADPLIGEQDLQTEHTSESLDDFSIGDGFLQSNFQTEKSPLYAEFQTHSSANSNGQKSSRRRFGMHRQTRPIDLRIRFVWISAFSFPIECVRLSRLAPPASEPQ